MSDDLSDTASDPLETPKMDPLEALADAALGDAEPISMQCAKCSAIATLFCTGCEGAIQYDDAYFRTYYCSKKCQEEHRLEHKSTCHRLRGVARLFRAGSILKELFLIYRELTFDLAVIKMEKTDGKMDVYEYRTGKEMTYCWSISSEVVPEREDREVIMSIHCAWEVLHLFGLLISRFLEAVGGIKEVMIADINVAYANLDVTIHSAARLRDADGSKHGALCIELEGGDKFILDIAGARFGIEIPLVPLRQYQMEYLEAEPSYRSFSNEVMIDVLCICASENLQYYRSRIHLANSVCFAVEEYLKIHEISLRRLLSLAGSEFFTHLCGLTKHVGDVMIKRVLDLEKALEYPVFPKIKGKSGEPE